ncbi:restriction endonuclease subunit S [Bacillus cereus]|uniref:restriction endonuclease subunit S n=1 Tax=Bacillus cereus TaxID=1396 RepID=UPI003980BD43
MSDSHNYKLTEIGKIPCDWNLVSLEDMADENDKHSFIDGDWIEARYIANEGVRLIQTGNIGIGNFKEKENKKYISEETFNSLKCKEVRTGDILICRLAAPIGRACIVPDISPKMITAVDVVVFRPQKKYCKEFINYALNFDNTLNRVASFASGSTRQRISRTNLGKLPLAIPNIAEQSKIAFILSSVDEAIEKTEAIIEQTEKVKKGLMQQLFTKGIGHTKFKKADIGEIPFDWEVVGIIDIAENEKNAVKPGPFGSSLKKEFYVKSGYKVYGQEQVIANDFTIGNYYIDDKKYEELNAFKVKPLDLLISLVGTFGKIAVVSERGFKPGIINPRLLKITFDKSKANVHFFKYYMSSSAFYQQLEGMSQGGTMGVINSKILKSIHFPLPSLDEQQRIVDILTNIDQKLDIETRKREQLQILKKGLMQSLLTGRVRVIVDEAEVTQV